MFGRFKWRAISEFPVPRANLFPKLQRRAGLGISHCRLAGKEQRFRDGRSEKFGQVQAIYRDVAIRAANVGVADPVPVMAADELLSQPSKGYIGEENFAKNTQAESFQVCPRMFAQGIGFGATGPTC
jgi:hypothetical protein